MTYLARWTCRSWNSLDKESPKDTCWKGLNRKFTGIVTSIPDMDLLALDFLAKSFDRKILFSFT